MSDADAWPALLGPLLIAGACIAWAKAQDGGQILETAPPELAGQ